MFKMIEESVYYLCRIRRYKKEPNKNSKRLDIQNFKQKKKILGKRNKASVKTISRGLINVELESSNERRQGDKRYLKK